MAKILIVDDNVSTRRYLELVLSSAHHEVLQAANGWEAVEIAKQRQPELIFMDLMMPVMDGETAAYVLKHDPATAAIPIVAVSARRVSDERAPYFTAYLAKPCHLSEFLGAVDAALQPGAKSRRSPSLVSYPRALARAC